MTLKTINSQKLRRKFLRAALSPLLLAALGAALLLAYPGPARADETPFGHIYTAETLPMGAVEAEQWMTWKAGKPGEDFYNLQMRSEIEYGFTNRLQGAFYLNYQRTKITPFAPIAPDGPVNTTEFSSVSGELIYQVLNPFTDPFGFAVYFEPGIGNDVRFLEWKLIFQKNFLEDRLVVAANINLEYEWERDGSEWERETETEFYLGASYLVAPNWYVGAELLNENDYERHVVFERSHAERNVFYFGPAIHYGGERWWATLGYYRQLPWAGNPAGDTAVIKDGLHIKTEENRVRLRVAVAL